MEGGKDVDADVDMDKPMPTPSLRFLSSLLSIIAAGGGGGGFRPPSFVVAYLRDTLAVLSSVQNRPGNATGVLSLQEQ